MRIYYVFDIRSEYVDLYKETPNSLYNVLHQLYYMRKKDLEYGFNMFKQLANRIDKDEVDKNIFLKLHNVIDLLNVDWDYINIQSNRSIKLEAINMWNNDLTIGTYDIANILNMTPQSVIHYLHEGNSECLCDFSKKEQYRRKQQRIHRIRLSTISSKSRYEKKHNSNK